MAISVQPDEAPAGIVRTALGETAASPRFGSVESSTAVEDVVSYRMRF